MNLFGSYPVHIDSIDRACYHSALIDMSLNRITQPATTDADRPEGPPLPLPWTEAERVMYLELYRSMLRIRAVEDAIHSLFVRGEVYGTTHLCSGQEAVCVGIASALGRDDRVAATYRGHGHALALGVDPQALLDEMLGRATGINGGRAGSMNINSLEHRLIGSFGIVGGSIAAATGAALAMRGNGALAVAFFGEGATNQAYFFECFNFAALYQLPVLFVCENNVYSEYTRTSDLSRGTIQDRAAALGVPGRQVDGMSVWAVRDAALVAVDAARSGAGPQFLEALTYRFVGHSRSDPAKYRPDGELDAWKARDPLRLCRERLTQEGTLSSDLEAVEAQVRLEVSQAVEEGLAAGWPDPEALPSEFKE
jgi:TPP-dependent pyruvate/acetoin dehydrogenase alpha subunit